jgi:hypothetical protein
MVSQSYPYSMELSFYPQAAPWRPGAAGRGWERGVTVPVLCAMMFEAYG